MRGFTLLLAVLIIVAGGQSAFAGRIGVASAVTNNVTGNGRALSSGDGVFQNQIVKTAASSSAQLLFLDETSMTVGPNSTVKLDRFVYNPNRKTGNVVLNVSKGAFRFVSGSAKSKSYKVKTPVATIGVRGTIFEGYFDSYGNLLLVLVEGAIEACSNLVPGLCVTLDVPGQYIKVSANGQITTPATWNGPTLDVRQGINFAMEENNSIRRLGRFSDPLPRSTELNDALDSRDTDIRFPTDDTPDVPGMPPGDPEMEYDDD